MSVPAPPVGRVFGLDVHAPFALAGVRAPVVTRGDRAIALALSERARLAARLERAEIVADRRADDQVLRIARDGEGWLWEATGYGMAALSADGREGLCAPQTADPFWQWQRLLHGQVLPLAAALQGLEPLHAAGVSVGGRAVCLAAGSAVGKSTLAAAILSAAPGARLLADDVVALEAQEQQPPLAHPGPALVYLRPGTAAPPGARPLSDDGEERVVEVEGAQQAMPLGAVYVLRRVATGPLAVVPAEHGDPRPLLAVTYDRVLGDRARLERRLAAIVAVLAHCEIRHVDIPAHAGPAATAEAILEDLA